MLELALNVRRGSFQLDVSCTLAAEWTVIFGPSGAGKSTLLRLIAGLEEPRSGRIALDGTVLTDMANELGLKPGRRGIAMVAQGPALFPHLNVARNVAYGIPGTPVLELMKRLEQLLELVGASGLIDRLPMDLSGGEAQRIALARALAPQPSLLLLDEPFSALDGAASDALLERLRNWTRAHNVQTIMATHDATDALAVGAEVALMREGRIIAQGPAADVLAEERRRIASRLG